MSLSQQQQYLLIKSKTFNNFISGIPNSPDLLKALVVGETKVVNGETFVVKMTPSGVPDWRKANQKDSTGNNSGLTNLNHLFDNDDFPDVADIEVVQNVSLGGSTGAVLVKDKNTGTQFVMKKGASKSHVEEEFLTNSIYRLMGTEVPEMKIYSSSTSTFILSKFMDNTSVANNVLDDLLKEDITESFVLDCLLANWDIYKNDNILVNEDTGKPVRVDNGGGLRFSATGRSKGNNFGDNVDELISMVRNNKSMTQFVTQDKIKEQIQDIVDKKDDILNLISDSDLRKTMTERIQFLENKLVSPLSAPKTKKNQNKKLTDKQLEKAYDAVGGDITKYDYKNGWLFLNEIAKLRGFDDLPTVVEEDEFQKLIETDGTHLVHRGVQGTNYGTAKDYMDTFVDGDCFFGTVGMYGAGIYAAVNVEKGNYTSSNPNYETALGYAGYKEENIMDLIIPKSAKVVDSEDLDNMMTEEFFGKEFKDKKAELDEEVRNLYDMKKKIEDFENQIEASVKKEMGWNEKTFKIIRASRPEIVYADTDKYPFSKALNYFTAVVNSINGKVTKLDDLNYEVSLPNSRETFILNSHSAEIALKQKNQFSVPYNFHYQRFKEFVIKNHYRNIESKVTDAIAEAKADNPEIKQFKQSLSDSEKRVSQISEEVDSLKTNGSETLNKVMAKVASRPNGEYRGFYAAIKGYDVIMQRNAWGDKRKVFAVILNRSKMIVKKF